MGNDHRYSVLVIEDEKQMVEMMHDFLAKPFEMASLYDIVNKVCPIEYEKNSTTNILVFG